MSTSVLKNRLGTALAVLVAVTAAPLAALAVPNTVSNVLGQAATQLGLSGGQAVGLYRVGGLALPGLLFAVPIGAVLARRLPAWIVLTAGLVLLLAAEAAVSAAGSVPLLGALRVAEGLGAGLALPASLVAIWGRGARALWAGVLAASLIAAMPLMLTRVPATDWREVLQPDLPLVAGALAVAGLTGLLLRGRNAPAARVGERTQLLLPAVPATGFAVLAVVTTYGWSPGAQLVVAAIGLAALLGLGLVGSADATTGSPLGFSIVAVGTGLLTLPVAAPLAGLLSTRTGAQHVPLLPFAVAAAAALAGALIGGRFPSAGLVLGGHGLMIMAVLLFLMTGPTSGTLTLAPPLLLLGAGAGLALGGALATTSLGAALFGLALLFPALLIGELAVGALQVARVNDAIKGGGGRLEEVYALTAAFRTWLIIGGIAAVLIAGVVALAARRFPARSVRPEADPATEPLDLAHGIMAGG